MKITDQTTFSILINKLLSKQQHPNRSEVVLTLSPFSPASPLFPSGPLLPCSAYRKYVNNMIPSYTVYINKALKESMAYSVCRKNDMDVSIM